MKSIAPRSYLIKTSCGIFRRNRKHLRPSSTFGPRPVVNLPYKSTVPQTHTEPDPEPTVPDPGPTLHEDQHTNQTPMVQREPECPKHPVESAASPPVGSTVRTTRSGRVINPPARYRND